MRAAQLANNTVVNFAEVDAFDGVTFIDPQDAVIGSTWNGLAFSHPAPPAPEVPQEVTKRRGLHALYLLAGLTDVQLEQAIITHITDPGAQYLALSEFRTSQTFQRQRPLVIQMGQLLGLDLDALFIKAGSLP